MHSEIKWVDGSSKIKIERLSDDYLTNIVMYLHKSNDIDRHTDHRYWILPYLIRELESRGKDPMITMYVASDGSHKNGVCQSSIIYYLYDYRNGYYQHDHKTERVGCSSNHRAEIKGCEMALEAIKESVVDRVNYYTDYLALVEYLQDELEKTPKGMSKLKGKYDSVSESVDIKVIRSPGHSGHMYNELADELASLRGEDIP